MHDCIIKISSLHLSWSHLLCSLCIISLHKSLTIDASLSLSDKHTHTHAHTHTHTIYKKEKKKVTCLFWAWKWSLFHSYQNLAILVSAHKFHKSRSLMNHGAKWIWSEPFTNINPIVIVSKGIIHKIWPITFCQCLRGQTFPQENDPTFSWMKAPPDPHFEL
jgi:predicted amidophosphoribosyltransferase